VVYRPKVLIVSPGIEDAGSRGIGRVTTSLIEGLRDINYDSYLLTGSILPKQRKQIANYLRKKNVEYYLNDGIKFLNSKMNKRTKLKCLIRDMSNVLIDKFTLIENESVIDNHKKSTKIRSFQKLSGFVNFSYFYILCRKLPISFRSYIIHRASKSINADYIITTSPFAIRKSKHNRNVKIIQYVHDLMPLNVLETPVDSGEWFANELLESTNNADIIISSSKNAKNLLKLMKPRLDVKLVYLSLEVENNKSYNKENFIVGDNVKISGQYILFMSALEKRKNIVRLIKGFQSIDNKDFKLVIAGGKGYGWDEINQYLKSLDKNTRKRIVITGYVDDSEKFQLINRSAIVIHPSIDEGLGIPVIEGMMASKPVIATKLDSLYEFIEESSVVLIDDPYNVLEITEKINYTIENFKELKSEALKNSKKVAKIFSKKAFNKKLEELFEIIQIKK
jgi:glycosyltransferase involved in cell wall biosynthesis